jgi:hypothetical protein
MRLEDRQKSENFPDHGNSRRGSLLSSTSRWRVVVIGMPLSAGKILLNPPVKQTKTEVPPGQGKL